ncbi:hypothetical protein [Janthinobacterium agaricidamnosum]|uniref:hypothetical protein n=1 Tax=Janthinobacterium agaricidamnosum TaxID=55508 RepID=UPI00056F7193|nr:hypothetical protein [Janthinobacterium agaricidamnosum]
MALSLFRAACGIRPEATQFLDEPGRVGALDGARRRVPPCRSLGPAAGSLPGKTVQATVRLAYQYSKVIKYTFCVGIKAILWNKLRMPALNAATVHAGAAIPIAARPYTHQKIISL